MKLIALFTALAVTLPSAHSYPGMEEALKEVELLARADSFNPNQLLGDLRTLKDNQLTRDGREIKTILSGRGNPENFDGYRDVPRRDSTKCRQDTCCVWKYIADDLERLFQGRSGRCTKWARYAIRMGFHDAGSWSVATEKQGGGADGSILLADGELSRGENTGLGDIAGVYRGVYNKYRNELGFKQVTMADLIQMGANVATVVCPLGPRVRSWVGRKDSTTPAPRNLLPSPFADANSLIQLFKDKTISPHGLIALLGAHTTSQQNVVDANRAGDPQDSTPGVWDVLYYQQTLGQVASPDRVFMFQSDLNLAKHPTTKKDFESFAGRGGQGRWNQVSNLSSQSIEAVD